LELREHTAQFHKAHNGLQVDQKKILIAPGSKILMFSENWKNKAKSLNPIGI